MSPDGSAKFTLHDAITALPPYVSESPRGGLPHALLERVSPLWFALALFLCVLVESFSPLDAAVQSLFYGERGWVVSQAMHDANRDLLYSWPKKVIMFGWVSFAVVFVCAIAYSGSKPALRAWIRPALLALLSISLIPLSINYFKYLTGVYCPEELTLYGGEQCYEGFLRPLLCEGRVNEGRCFPAAHCSGGFAFMALYFLPVSRQWRCALFYGGASWGAFMGIYQMLRGQHFLSHTLVTICFALLFIAVAARRLRLVRS